MNRTIALLAAAGVVALAPVAHAKTRVVSTTEDLAYFARVIGGPEVEATSILKGFQDPHFVAAKPSFMVQVSRADMLLSVGLDLEIGWLPLILQGARNPSVMPGNAGFVDCAQFVQPTEVPPAGADRSKGDLHPRGNPHYWLDPDRAKQVAWGIADRLTGLDPAHAATFAAGLKTMLAEIDAGNEAARAVLAATPASPVVTYHVTFSYFFEHFGLAPAGFIEPKPGIPPTPAHVAGLIARLKAGDHPPVLIVEPFYDMDVPRRIAEQTDAKVVLTPSSIGGVPAVTTYRDLLVAIAKAVRGQ